MCVELVVTSELAIDVIGAYLLQETHGSLQQQQQFVEHRGVPNLVPSRSFLLLRGAGDAVLRRSLSGCSSVYTIVS